MRKFELFEDAVGRVIVWCKDKVHVSILLFCCYFRGVPKPNISRIVVTKQVGICWLVLKQPNINLV